MKSGWILPVVAGVLIIGMCAASAPLAKLEASILNPAEAYYNLLVQGFRAGQLSLKKEAPPGLAQLADPYDPVANDAYQDFANRLRDLSYYKGKLYPYFGVTPALMLFWPFVALTGKYLSDRQAVMIFSAIGILTSVGLLRALWRRYFAEVSVGVVVVCALALGLATGVPTMLPRSEVHEVATSCGYMLTMLALAAVWCAVHDPERRCRWLAAASLAYGLAVGARPSLLLGAAILLVPVLQARRERRPILALLTAAIGPLVLVGLGLMLYNALRFDNPFEFGWRYQLAGKRQVMMQFLSPRFLWFNFRVYFLGPPQWSARFPFVHEIAAPPLPVGYYWVPESLGILTNIPLAWLALAVPLALRNRSEPSGSTLRWFITAVTLLFGICALTVGLFCYASIRYAVDFLPALVVLAVVGILGLERVLANRPVWQRTARCGWGMLLGFSVAFNLLVSLVNYGHASCALAGVLAYEDRVPEAIQIFEKALRISPDDANGHCRLGLALLKTGKIPEAIEHYQQALRINPDYAEAHNDLASIYLAAGMPSDAIAHYEQALRGKPDYPEVHYNLGFALQRVGRTQEAVEQFELALKLSPNFAPAKEALSQLQTSH